MNIGQEGVLLKWTNYLYGWKKRYFVLHDGLLEYCKQKGNTLKGKMSLFTIDVKKHPKEDSRLILNTGTNLIHLKAQNPKEAQEWFVALKRAMAAETDKSINNFGSIVLRNSIDEKLTFPKILTNKIQELWNAHALIGDSIEKIPQKVRSNCPELEKLMSLCNTFKMLSSETLSLLESEESCAAFKKKVNHTSRGSIESSKMIYSPKNLESSNNEEEKSDESIEFEDAHSHYSEEEYPNPYRKCLPCLRNPNQKYNIWRVVKDSVGKELSKIAVPVYFNEPISFLQRFSEDLTYNEVILNACDIQDSCLRLAYVACFAVTSYVSSQQRTMKPFNPLLGETYELVKDGYRIVAEQVCHHPPISALYCEHHKFTFWASVEIKTSFKGTHLNVIPTGKYHLIIKEFNDHYIWEKPQTNVHNIIFGKMYVDNYGKLEAVNINTGEKALLNFHKKGWLEKVSHEVTGIVLDSNASPRYKVFGQWNNHMNVQDIVTNKITTVWEKYPYPENYDHNYFFSEFAIQLNIPPEFYKGLPKTDSRYRPDQRALESGDIKLAGSEKNRLEEKQRIARKIREEQKTEYFPKWFHLENNEWVYSGGYWESREQNNFIDLPDIF
jgi:Oxysterol-binding protein/PH domain